MALDSRKAGLLDRMSPDSQSTLLGQEIMRLWGSLESLEVSVNLLKSAEASGQKFFSKTARLSALAASTRIHILAEAEIPDGKVIHPLGFFILLDGEVAWEGGTGTTIYIADSGTDLIYRFAGIQSAQLVAGNYISPTTDGVTLEAEFGMSLGCRAGKGIDMLADGKLCLGERSCRNRLWLHGMTVEDGSGFEEADSYSDITRADLYHSARGNMAWMEAISDAKNAALVRACDYVERGYGRLWPGARVSVTQRLSFPRYGMDTIRSDEIPTWIIEAQCEGCFASSCWTLGCYRKARAKEGL